MGEKRTGKGVRGESLVLDAGALIAAERGSKRVTVLVQEAAELGLIVTVPASVLAQVWRGGSTTAFLARLLVGCETDPLDEGRAKGVGERLGARATADIADGHVVCCALEHRAAVATSDPADMKALTKPDEHLAVIAV